MDIREPEPPWFVNVRHYRYRYRPLCSSPVDYEHAMWSENIEDVDCARCHREYPPVP